MWRPNDVEALRARLRAGDLEESQTFDGKRELGSNNVDIAVDVCAMTVACGVLVYGIAENSGGTRLTEASPIPLEGARERINQIATNSIAEPPQIEIASLEEPDQPGMGYVIVTIPPSSRAPHQIVVKGKSYGRFYGRDATGNRVLTQSEVAALYARRDQIEGDGRLDMERELRDWCPEAFDAELGRVCIALRARPAMRDDGLTKRAAGPAGASNVETMLSQVTGAGAGLQIGEYEPNLRGLVGLWRLEDADHWGSRWVGRDQAIELAMLVSRGGQAVLFGRRVGDTLSDDIVVFEEAVAGLTAGFLKIMGDLYGRAGYLGPVDVGVIVRPLRGTVGAIPRHQLRGRPYPRDQFSRQTRFAAGQLEAYPKPSARTLVGDLMTAFVGEGYDPFAEASWIVR